MFFFFSNTEDLPNNWVISSLLCKSSMFGHSHLFSRNSGHPTLINWRDCGRVSEFEGIHPASPRNQLSNQTAHFVCSPRTWKSIVPFEALFIRLCLYWDCNARGLQRRRVRRVGGTTTSVGSNRDPQNEMKVAD